MSYTIEFEIDTGGERPHAIDNRNPTYNLGRIFYSGLGVNLRELSGANAEATTPCLEAAYTKLCDPALESEFRALEPDNGWGTLEGAQEIIGWMLKSAREHPKSTIRVR